ncbi:MAG: hypothetical protein R2713_13785 [Ilumatobacteraceae bacterium]
MPADPGMCSMQGRAFDVYVVVDWSNVVDPELGRLDLGACAARPTVAADPVNLPTRASAFEGICDTLCRRPVGGCWLASTCPYGYPSGLRPPPGSTMPPASPWRSTWRTVGALAADSASNRFEAASAMEPACRRRSWSVLGPPRRRVT